VRHQHLRHSNLIEGHGTRPRDLQKRPRRSASRSRSTAWPPRRLPEPASVAFVRRLHREFYRDASEAVLRIRGTARELRMVPGERCSDSAHDVAVGRHLPPSSARVADSTRQFETRHRFDRIGKAARIMATAAATIRSITSTTSPTGTAA
jgi:Fic family protein